MPSVIPDLLKSNRAREEEGFLLPRLSLANLIEEGCHRPKPYNFGVIGTILKNAAQLFTIKGEGRDKENKVGWGDLPPELWAEIGKRMWSRLDILRFRSVCKKLRSSLPSPTRFPLWVPPPPDMTRLWPNVITEYSAYKCRGVSGVLTFEEKNRAGKLCALHIYFDTLGLKLCSYYLDCPMISLMASPNNPFSPMSWISTTYCLRMDLSLVGSDKKMDQDFAPCRFAKDIVIISSNATDGVNPSYASASDLTAVALVRGTGRLALLRLGGSYEDLVWETDFCDQVFKDIATYRGQLCALDPQGRVFLMDYNSLQMTHVSHPWDRAIRAEFKAKILKV